MSTFSHLLCEEGEMQSGQRSVLVLPGFELLKREAGSRLTQPGVSAIPTRHSLTEELH